MNDMTASQKLYITKLRNDETTLLTVLRDIKYLNTNRLGKKHKIGVTDIKRALVNIQTRIIDLTEV